MNIDPVIPRAAANDCHCAGAADVGGFLDPGRLVWGRADL